MGRCSQGNEKMQLGRSTAWWVVFSRLSSLDFILVCTLVLSLVYIRSGGGACFNSRFLNPPCRNSDSTGQGVDPEICILIITPFTG